MTIEWDEYGLSIDTEWLYLAINKWLVAILVIGFIGYKIYKKRFIKLNPIKLEKSDWE